MRYLQIAKAMVTRRVPIYVHYGVTHRCNLTCRMCGLWKIGNRKTELDLDEIRQMADNLHELGTAAVSLGGGEPFLRQDLDEIIRTFMARNIQVRCLTNGVVPNPRLIKKVMDTGLRHISISLDTLDKAKQADICNKAGIWDKITEAVRFWAEYLRPRRGLGIINCVVTRLNHEELPRVVEYAERYGFYVSFVPIELHHYRDKDLGCRDSFHDMPFTAEDERRLDETFARLIEMKAQGRHIFNSTPFLQYALKYLKGQPTGWRCRAGSLSFSVSPEGLFSMCHRFRGTGEEGTEEISVADPGFVEWFRSRNVAEASDKIASTCQACFRPCWQEVGLTFTHPKAMMEMLQLQRPDTIPQPLPSPEEVHQNLMMAAAEQVGPTLRVLN